VLGVVGGAGVVTPLDLGDSFIEGVDGLDKDLGDSSLERGMGLDRDLELSFLSKTDGLVSFLGDSVFLGYSFLCDFLTDDCLSL